jgi:hypothetical protein
MALKATALALCAGSAAAFSAPLAMQLRESKPAIARGAADALTGWDCAAANIAAAICGG